MAKKNVFLKKLDIIETFGAATIVASDKTGTLTKNDMTVSDLWYDGKFTSGLPEVRHRVLSAKRNSIKVDQPIELLDAPLPTMFRVMAVCNKAKIERVSSTSQNGNAKRGIDNPAMVSDDVEVSVIFYLKIKVWLPVLYDKK